jgi:hypothetical protein
MAGLGCPTRAKRRAREAPRNSFSIRDATLNIKKQTFNIKKLLLPYAENIFEPENKVESNCFRAINN